MKMTMMRIISNARTVSVRTVERLTITFEPYSVHGNLLFLRIRSMRYTLERKITDQNSTSEYR